MANKRSDKLSKSRCRISRASGKVIKDNAVIGYFEYNATVSVALSCIYSTAGDMLRNWRSNKNYPCVCGDPPTDVILFTSYADGFYWRGKVCLKCKAIVSGQMPFEEDAEITEGNPLRKDRD